MQSSPAVITATSRTDRRRQVALAACQLFALAALLLGAAAVLPMALRAVSEALLSAFGTSAGR